MHSYKTRMGNTLEAILNIKLITGILKESDLSHRVCIAWKLAVLVKGPAQVSSVITGPFILPHSIM